MKAIVKKPWSSDGLLKRQCAARELLRDIEAERKENLKRADVLRRRMWRVMRYLDVVTSNLKRNKA